jgi:hypothetical protein
MPVTTDGKYCRIITTSEELNRAKNAGYEIQFDSTDCEYTYKSDACWINVPETGILMLEAHLRGQLGPNNWKFRAVWLGNSEDIP